jgi:Ca2+-binding EF-hand superfamily protein
MPKTEKKELSKIFQSLDKNCEGRLTQEGMFEGYKVNFGANKLSLEAISSIFENVNFDKKKDKEYITFTDFIMAAVDMNKVILTNHYLTLAF